PADVCLLLLEHLHDDARAATVGAQRLAGVVEVRIGVVAGAHLVDREVEHLGIETLSDPALSLLCDARAPDRPRARPRRPRAARVSARPSRTGAGARGPASRAHARGACPD